MKVLIIGAGPAGLALAQGLKKAGIPATVYEKYPANYAQREWGVMLHWGKEYLSKVLPMEMVDRIPEAEADPYHPECQNDGITICNGETGEVILIMKADIPPRRLNRRKLRALLSEGVEIEYGKSIASLSLDATGDTVIATFADGTTANGTILVGCDGARSKVRQALFSHAPEQAELSDAGLTFLNFPYSYPAEMSKFIQNTVHPVFKVAYHPKLNQQHLLANLDIPDPNDYSTHLYQHLLSWRGSPTAADLNTPAAVVAHLKKAGAQFAEPWRTAALGVDDSALLRPDPGMYWDPRGRDWEGTRKTWKGRVTVAGDAAHPMLSQRAQGLNNALQDSAMLTEALSSISPAALSEPGDRRDAAILTAVTTYETEMIARGGREVEVTNRQAELMHDWSRMRQAPIFRYGVRKNVELDGDNKENEAVGEGVKG